MDHLLTDTSSCCRFPPGPRVDYLIICDVFTIDLDFTSCTVIIILVHPPNDSGPFPIAHAANESDNSELPRLGTTWFLSSSGQDTYHLASSSCVVSTPLKNTYSPLVAGDHLFAQRYSPGLGAIMSKDELELQRACKENDIARVHELFTTRSLDHEDATHCTFRTSEPSLMRCLLEHGADLRWYLEKHAPPSLDMIKLFVEFGYDVKSEGHKILQPV
jgi:hypothetical protein